MYYICVYVDCPRVSIIRAPLLPNVTADNRECPVLGEFIRNPWSASLFCAAREHSCTMCVNRFFLNDCQGFNNLSYTIHLR